MSILPTLKTNKSTRADVSKVSVSNGQAPFSMQSLSKSVVIVF